MDIDAIKREMVETSLHAYNRFLFAGTSGNLSFFVRDTGVMLIKPTGARYETMQPSDIVEMRLDGTVLSSGTPSSEWRMHAEIYKTRPDVCSVFHTHSKYATAFAVLGEDIPQVLIEMGVFLGGKIPCAHFENPGSYALGQSVCRAMGKDYVSCLMESHGALAVGETVAQAFLRAEYVEDAANIYYLARSIGNPKIL